MSTESDAVHYVYRMFDKNGVALYVGCTSKPDQRYGQHVSARMRIIQQVDRYQVTTHRGRTAGRSAEKAEIQRLEPLYNAEVAWMGTRKWTRETFRDHARALAELSVIDTPNNRSALGRLHTRYRRLFQRDLFGDMGAVRFYGGEFGEPTTEGRAFSLRPSYSKQAA